MELQQNGEPDEQMLIWFYDRHDQSDVRTCKMVRRRGRRRGGRAVSWYSRRRIELGGGGGVHAVCLDVVVSQNLNRGVGLLLTTVVV